MTDYTLAELSRLADVTPRTVRYYIAQGLLPSPDAAGPATRYAEAHLARLRLIKRLQREHLPLAEIRVRLERMTDAEIETVGGVPAQTARMDSDTALAYVRDLMARSGVSPRFYARPAPGTPSPVAPAPAPAPDAEQATTPGAPAPGDPTPSIDASPPITAAALAMAPPGFHSLAKAAGVEPAGYPDLSAGEPNVAAAERADLYAAGAAAAVAGAAMAASHSTQPDRSTWERIALDPDVEIHVRRPLDRHTNKRVDRLLRIARELFEDDAT